MIVYLLYVISPILIYSVYGLITKRDPNYRKEDKNVYLIIAGIVIFLMIGLRHPGNGSVDTRRYYEFWETMSRVSFKELGYTLKNIDLEIGYQLTTWGLSQIFHHGQWQLIFSGAFYAISVCYFVKRNCPNAVLALTVFNCLGLFNFMVQGLRQSIAMCICLWAIEQCKNRKLMKFILLILLASLFHASALVFLIVYILSMLRLDIKSGIIAGVAMAIGMLLLPQFFALINKAMNDSYEIGTIVEGGGVVAIIIYIIIVVFGLVFRDKNDSTHALFVYMAIIGCIMMIMRNSVSTVVERIAQYFAFAQMAIVSNSIELLRDKKSYFLIGALIIVLCVGVAVHKVSYSSLIPYQFFWM